MVVRVEGWCWQIFWLCLLAPILFIHSAKISLVLDPEKLTISISLEHKATYKSPGSYSLPYSLPSLWKLCKRISPLSPFDQATWQHPRESPRHVRGSARIYDVRMAQFVLKIAKLSHIIGAHGSQDLRSPSPIMAPDWMSTYVQYTLRYHGRWNFTKNAKNLFFFSAVQIEKTEINSFQKEWRKKLF